MKKKISGRIFFCLVFVLFTVSATIGQEESDTQVGRPDELSIVLGSSPVNQNPDIKSAESGIGSLVRLILVLLLVCGGLWGIMRVFKKSSRFNAADDPYLKQLAQLSISPNQSIRVVSLGEKAFLLGLTEHAFTLLAEVDDRELIDAMLLESSKLSSASTNAGFATLISKFLPARLRDSQTDTRIQPSSTTESYGSDSAADTAEFLRRQRDRLRNSGEGDRL